MTIITGRFWLCALIYCFFNFISVNAELRLLHVLSANKFYVPDFNSTSTEFQAPKNLTYRYFLSNAVDIPNNVKLELFNLGEHLRLKYGEFIGSFYNDEVSKMQTVGFPASIMAGELINAGLWPPVDQQIWKDDLAWQPIPFDYQEVNEDALLLGARCSNFEHHTEKIIKEHYKMNEMHKTLLQHIKEYGKINVENPIDVLMLHLAIDNSIQLNQTLPKWITDIYTSENLTNLTLTAYDLLSKNTSQKRLNGGSLLKKIIYDSKSHINGSLHKNRKINLYSGDDRNFAGILKIFNISMIELPGPGDALIFELNYENNEYYLTVNYYQSDIKDQSPFPLQACGKTCSIDNLLKLVADFLPEDEKSLCGSTITEVKKTNANNIILSNPLLSFASLVFSYLITRI